MVFHSLKRYAQGISLKILSLKFSNEIELNSTLGKGDLSSRKTDSLGLTRDNQFREKAVTKR